MKYNDIKIAYIGGGSRGWARTFMYDLALQSSFSGSVNLYDIDLEAANMNRQIGLMINEDPRTVSKFSYHVFATLEDAVRGVDFVMLSILPGTFAEMESDVHLPEKYGIYQSVGDTVGPGGIIRAMRTIPMYEQFAAAIRDYAPNAFVINFTNPMTLCTRTLYDVFPDIKAFGCCHEVFGTQAFLAEVVSKVSGIKGIKRQDIKTDVNGINHFTWFSKAEYNGQDIFPLYRAYIKQASESDDGTQGINPFESSNKVKMDLFARFGQIAAAGDRHLAEFVSGSWYLKNPETVKKWGFGLTTVEWRKQDLRLRIKQTEELVYKTKPLAVEKSDEEFICLMEGLVGLKDFVSNVNLPNTKNQAPYAPAAAVVETNASFTKGKVEPLHSEPLSPQVVAMVLREIHQQENALRAIRSRNLNDVFTVFVQEPLMYGLSLGDGERLFMEMVKNTSNYLSDWHLKL